MRALVLALILTQAAVSTAADRSIGAVKLELKRSSSGKEKLTFTSKDVNLLFPALGSGDDPSTGGASITLVSPVEALVTFPVPAGLGNPGWRVYDRTLDSYTYRNGGSPGGPSVVRSLSMREGRGIKLAARAVGLTLAGAQGSVGIRIATGSSRRCALFEGTSVVIDQPNRFLAKGAVATGGDCSDAALGAPSSPTTTSTTIPGCGNGVREGTEQCDGTDGLEGAPLGVECDGACQFCGTSTCRFPGPIDIPCCNGTACIILGPHGGVCGTTTTTTSTTSTTIPTCGDGVVQSGEQCDGTACNALLDGCFPEGHALECNCCSSLECYFGGISSIVHCCPGKNCESGGQSPPIGDTGVGFCTTATCAFLQHACSPDPNFLACCPGLVCAVPFGSPNPIIRYCLAPPGLPCTASSQCVYQSCVGNVCQGPS